MTSSNQFGWDRKYTLTEAAFHEKKLPDDIGVKWKDLARALGFNQAFITSTEKEKNYCAKECCIEVLVRWREREGKDATAQKLVQALVKIELKNVAERFPCKPSDPSQNSEAVSRDLEEKESLNGKTHWTNCVSYWLEERGCGRVVNEHGWESSNEQWVWLTSEITKMNTRIKELEDEVPTLKARTKELESCKEHKGECEGNNASKKAKQAARESRVSEILQKCKEELETYVTKPLVVPEVRQGNLPRTAVTVDVLKVLSEHLEEQYNTTLDIAPEAWQCSEDLRDRFYRFAYHALQTEDDEMNLKINNLKKTLKKAHKDDKEEFKNLTDLQKRRKDLVVKLEKWRHLFFPSINQRCSSDTTGKKPEPSHSKERRPISCPSIIAKKPLPLSIEEES